MASTRIAFARGLLVSGLVSLLGAPGCGSSAEPETVRAPEDGLPASCNPLRTEGACLYPFPSAVFLAEDSSTSTGYKVQLTKEAMPKSTGGKLYDPARLNLLDGFSPSAEILAYFSERIDPATLPPIADPGKSLMPGSGTVVVDMETGKRVAHFSEVDAQAQRDEDRQALIIRPIARLASGRRYAVAVTSATRAVGGAALNAPPGFAAIADGVAKDGLAGKQAARMPAIFAALEKAEVLRTDVVLAWDFVTGSDERLTRTMRSMRDETLKTLGGSGLGYTIKSVEPNFSEHALMRVRGTFTVPKYISQTDVSVVAATLTFDADGKPVASGTYEAPFTLIVPRSVKDGPAGLLLFGHGFLGSGESELGDAQGSVLQTFADEKRFALVATDWSGLSRYEGLDAAGSGAAAEAVNDVNGIPWISDRLQQSLVNAMTLARTSRGGIAKDPVLAVDGKALIDASRIDYFGISLGGVLGSSLMGWSPDLDRGVLNVGAAGWSTLFQRSQNWGLFKLIIDGAYPDKLDQQIVLELLQAYLDTTEGMSVAPHVLADPLPGAQPKQILLQMGVNDLLVPNIATEGLARSLKLPVLADSNIPIYGVEAKAGPLASALTVWDLHEQAPPLGNVPASVASPNKVHSELRALGAVQSQIDVFLRSGEVRSFCKDACDPE